MNVNKNTYTFTFAVIMVIIVAAILSSTYIQLKPLQDKNIELEKQQNILSSIGIDSLGIGSSNNYQVNSITFSVALDKVGFMPLISVDSMSGIIVTDWYSLDDGESRIKINIRIVDQEMSDESVTVSLFTQTLDGDRWIDQGINSEQSLKIKESILTSARSLAIASEL